MDGETVEVQWGGFKDDESNVKGYDVCLGSSPGATDFAECVNTEADKRYVFRFLDLVGKDDVKMYASVFARNGERLESMIAQTLVIDDSAPVVSSAHVQRVADGRWVTQPLVKHSDPQSLAIALDIREPNPQANVQINVVEVAVGLGPDSFQDAAEWSEVQHDFVNDGSRHEFTLSRLQMQHQGQYFVHIRTTNTLGRQAITTIPSAVYIDITPPTATYVRVHNGRSIMTEYNLKWLKQSVDPRYTANNWILNPSWSFADKESSMTQCYVSIVDANGSVDDLIATKRVKYKTKKVKLRERLPDGFDFQVHARCQSDAGLWGEGYSPPCLVDLTRPTVAQVLDLGEIPTTTVLSETEAEGSALAQGLLEPRKLTGAEVNKLEVDFVASLDQLRVGFSAWDLQSGAEGVMVAAGVNPGSASLMKWTYFRREGMRYVTLNAGILKPLTKYFVSVAAVNVSSAPTTTTTITTTIQCLTAPTMSCLHRELACCPRGSRVMASSSTTRRQCASSTASSTAPTDC